jgi:uncharacterized protein (UPF0332 family)
VSSPFAEEVAAYLERSARSIEAAQQLMSTGFYDFAASRSYYAAFYAANALVLLQQA